MKTDDPVNQQFYLVIKGAVEAIVTVQPKMVSLSGNPGQVLESVVTIRPSQAHPMSIKGLEQKFSQEIRAELVAPKAQGDVWRVKVRTESKAPGDFWDVVTLKTDNAQKPIIKIRVYAIYTEKGKS